MVPIDVATLKKEEIRDVIGIALLIPSALGLTRPTML
jgi:hypothetical protein